MSFLVQIKFITEDSNQIQNSELQFLIKTKSSIFNRKVYTTDSKREPSMAWLGKIETDSILIKEKCINTYLKCQTGCLNDERERKRSRFE